MKFYIPMSGWFPVVDVYTDRAEWIGAYRTMQDDRTVRLKSIQMIG